MGSGSSVPVDKAPHPPSGTPKHAQQRSGARAGTPHAGNAEVPPTCPIPPAIANDTTTAAADGARVLPSLKPDSKESLPTATPATGPKSKAPPTVPTVHSKGSGCIPPLVKAGAPSALRVKTRTTVTYNGGLQRTTSNGGSSHLPAATESAKTFTSVAWTNNAATSSTARPQQSRRSSGSGSTPRKSAADGTIAGIAKHSTPMTVSGATPMLPVKGRGAAAGAKESKLATVSSPLHALRGVNGAPGAGAAGDGIISVATPPGVGNWSSSSSSSGSLRARGNANGGAGSFGARRFPLGVDGRRGASGHMSPRGGSATSGPSDDRLTPELLPLSSGALNSFDLNDDDCYDLNSSNGANANRNGLIGGGSSRSGKSGMVRARLVADNESSHNGLATFFNRPKECHNCQSSAVAYGCDTCTSFYLCEDCRFDEKVLERHPASHRITPLHEAHCNSSRTFGGSSSLLTVDGVSSLFYDPCSACSRVIDDAEPVYRCETCDFIICDSCHSLKRVAHDHELRRFQRRTRNDYVTEGTLLNKSRTNDGNKIINDYVIVRLLGQGSYAKVKLVQNIRTRQLYALKILRKHRRSQGSLLNRSRIRQGDDDLLREIAVMKFVNHPNIVKLAEVIDDVEAGKLYLIMEYCAKGPVHTSGNAALSVEKVRKHGIGILGGLLHLHSEFLYHRDVKPANCLVDGQDVVKIADFGTCNSRIRTTGIDGTPAFTSPEQIRGEEVSGDVADSWAFALTLYQMAYGSLPCDGMAAFGYREFLTRPEPIPIPPASAVEKAAALRRERRPSSGGILPPPCAAVQDAELNDLLVKMLAKDMKQRMLLGAAAYHPFFRLNKAEVRRLCQPCLPLDASALGSRRSIAGGTGTNAIVATGGAVTSSSGRTDHHGGGPHVVAVSESPPSPPGGGGRRRNSGPSRGTAAWAKLSPVKVATTFWHTNTSTTTTNGGGGAAAAGDRDTSLDAFTPPAAGNSSRFSHLYERALQEVRRGKNLTEAFYGVKSLRRVRRKDVKNSDHDVEDAEDGGASTSLGDLDSGSNNGGGGPRVPSPPGARRSTGRADSGDGNGNNSNSRVYSPSGAHTPKKPVCTPPLGGPIGRALRTYSESSGGSAANNNLSPQPRLSQSSLSDATFDLATIVDRVAQQKIAGTGTLELVRLKMYSVPAAVNDVADITVNLRFSLNSLASVASVKFSQFALLKDITITSNQLRRFPDEVLKAPRLLRLDLSHNNITSIPPTLTKARFLERLNLHSNNIKNVAIDSQTKLSVLAAPSLRHVRLSSNPLEGLPKGLDDSAHGIELVLDANPVLMKEWYELVNRTTHAGRAPSAVVVWDDYFPVRVAGTAYDVWIASGDLSLYRAHTLKMCGTPFVILFSAADHRFPKGGTFTSAQLTEYLQKNNTDPRRGSNGSNGGGSNSRVAQRLPRSGSRDGESGGSIYAVSQPPPRPLPSIIARESRAFVHSYFFVCDDAEDETGGYHALFDFLVDALAKQEPALVAKGITPPRATATPEARRKAVTMAADSALTPVSRREPDNGVDNNSFGGIAVELPRTGNGLMVILMSSSAVKDAREVAVAALADSLCKMSLGTTEEQLKIYYDAVMDATRSLYA